MTSELEPREVVDLLSRLTSRVRPGPPPLWEVRAEAARRRRRQALAVLSAAAVVVLLGGGSLAAVALTGGPHDTSRVTASATASSDPQTLAALQGAWTLHLTNAAPDGQQTTGLYPDVTLTIDGSRFDTTDGVHAIQGRLRTGPVPRAGELSRLSTYDIETASPPPSPGEQVEAPPVVSTLQHLASFSQAGDTFLLHTSNAAIVAVLRPQLPGIGRVEGTVRTQPVLVANGVGGVRVTLTPTGGGRPETLVSDGDGGFGIDLPVGGYTVSLDSGPCTPSTPVTVVEFQTAHGSWRCPAAPLVN